MSSTPPTRQAARIPLFGRIWNMLSWALWGGLIGGWLILVPFGVYSEAFNPESNLVNVIAPYVFTFTAICFGIFGFCKSVTIYRRIEE